MSMVGSTIEKIRWMTDAETEKEGWSSRGQRGVVLEIQGGGKIYASRDGEGNGPGVFFGVTAEGESIYVVPEEPLQKG